MGWFSKRKLPEGYTIKSWSEGPPTLNYLTLYLGDRVIASKLVLFISPETARRELIKIAHIDNGGK